MDLCERALQSSATSVLLVAPAGFGKTTTMTQLREQLQTPDMKIGWLTIEPGDNDLQQFIARLDRATSGFARAPASSFTLHKTPPVEVIERFGHSDGAFTLFIDEAETLNDLSAWRLLRQIAERIPPGSRMIIATRQLPAIGFARLRANGHLIQFDDTHLRFSLRETHELFQRWRLSSISKPDCEALAYRTEGWPTALVLAAMALEHHEDPTNFIHKFPDSARWVSDYLSEEVLSRQPSEVRDFLLGTCILRKLTAALCQDLLPHLDCADLLERVTRANLFLTPDENEPDCWRYHALFADFLRQHLLRAHPASFAQLHLTAAKWHEKQQQFALAIDHAIKSGDHAYAISLLCQHAERFLAEGQFRMLANWFDALPDSVLRKLPMLQICAIWACSYTCGGLQAQQMLDSSGCISSQDPDILAHVHVLVPLLLALRDRPLEAYELACKYSRHLPTTKPLADHFLIALTGHLAAAIGDREGAVQLLEEARRRQGGSSFGHAYIESVEGELDLQEGLLRQATARIRIALKASKNSVETRALGNAFPAILFAYTVYESDRLVEAEQLLRVYLPVIQSMGFQDHDILGSIMLSRIAVAASEPDEAARVLAEMEDLGQRYGLPRLIASAHLERARQLILLGNADAADAALKRADNPQVWLPERKLRRLAHICNDLIIGRLRWAVHFACSKELLRQIESELAWAQAHRRQLRVMTLSLFRAVVLHRIGNLASALDCMHKVLRSAADQGFVRHVLDEGVVLRPLLTTLSSSLDQRGYSADPVLQEYLHRLLAGLAQHPGPVPDTVQPAVDPLLSGLIERLTPKEMNALQLLAEGCSNGMMAERLGVSDSTIRTHLRNINAKLDAQSRTQAVAKARQYGLIP